MGSPLEGRRLLTTVDLTDPVAFRPQLVARIDAARKGSDDEGRTTRVFSEPFDGR